MSKGNVMNNSEWRSSLVESAFGDVQPAGDAVSTPLKTLIRLLGQIVGDGYTPGKVTFQCCFGCIELDGIGEVAGASSVCVPIPAPGIWWRISTTRFAGQASATPCRSLRRCYSTGDCNTTTLGAGVMPN